jgi:signal transduction histidine kinase
MAIFLWMGPITIRPGLAADAGMAAPLGALGAIAGGLLLALYLFWRRLKAAKQRLAAMERRTGKLTDDLERQRSATAHLQSVLDTLPFPVWWRRSDLSIEGRNRAAAVLVDPPPLIETKLAARAAKAGAAQSESRHFIVDGERRLLELTESVIEQGDEATVGHATDVTTLERVQTDLAEHVAAHDEVLERLAAAIAVFGPDRRLKFFNTAFTRLWRIDASHIRDEPTYSELLDILRDLRRLPEIVDFPMYKQEQDALFTSLIDPAETMMHLPDNRTLRVVTAPHPFGGLLFVYEDVTDRLALERSYNTLIAVQRETLNNFHEAVAVYGADGRLRLWNPALVKHWRFNEFDLQGEPRIGELIDKVRHYFKPSADWPRLRERLVLQVTEPKPLSGRLERTNGTTLQYTIVPLPDGGCLVTYLDVTDSIRVQRVLEDRYAALEQADKLKTEFIARMSYELRTPLNSIQGFTELLLRDEAVDGLSNRQQEYLDDIGTATGQLLVMINNVLDYAAIEAGYLEIKRQPTDMEPLLRDEIKRAKPAADARGLSLTLDCAADIGPVVLDPNRFRQVLRNLLSNAMKFTPAGGAVTVSALRDDGDAVLSIADTGVGFDDSSGDRLFERFEVGDGQVRGSGVGLGLALVRSLIELHGGKVTLSSTPGEGTVATCRIPVGRPDRQLAIVR